MSDNGTRFVPTFLKQRQNNVNITLSTYQSIFNKISTNLAPLWVLPEQIIARPLTRSFRWRLANESTILTVHCQIRARVNIMFNTHVVDLLSSRTTAGLTCVLPWLSPPVKKQLIRSILTCFSSLMATASKAEKHQAKQRKRYRLVCNCNNSSSCNKSFKIKLVTSCHLKICQNLLEQLAASLWITSLDNQLAPSLLTTCDRLAVNKHADASWYRLVDNKSVTKCQQMKSNLSVLACVV